MVNLLLVVWLLVMMLELSDWSLRVRSDVDMVWVMERIDIVIHRVVMLWLMVNDLVMGVHWDHLHIRVVDWRELMWLSVDVLVVSSPVVSWVGRFTGVVHVS